jgi:hypothetical protein
MNTNAARLVELVEGLVARVELLEAHQENLIERVYELEGGDSMRVRAVDASGFEAEQRLRLGGQ